MSRRFNVAQVFPFRFSGGDMSAVSYQDPVARVPRRFFDPHHSENGTRVVTSSYNNQPAQA
jgi:hypothetical protein